MPAFQCFLNTLANELVVSPTMKVFRAAQLFRLRAVKVSRPTAADVERIRPRDLPFKNTNDVIQSLKDELPTYLVKATRLVMPLISFLTPCNGGKTYVSPDLPSRSFAVQKVVPVQPSSAAADRVFSLLVIMFGDQQHDALEDYVEAALMLRVNDS